MRSSEKAKRAKEILAAAGGSRFISQDVAERLLPHIIEALAQAYAEGHAEGQAEGMGKLAKVKPAGEAWPAGGQFTLRLVDGDWNFRPLEELRDEILQRAIAHHGDDTKAAKHLQVPRQRLFVWRKKRGIPASWDNHAPRK